MGPASLYKLSVPIWVSPHSRICCVHNSEHRVGVLQCLGRVLGILPWAMPQESNLHLWDQGLETQKMHEDRTLQELENLWTRAFEHLLGTGSWWWWWKERDVLSQFFKKSFLSINNRKFTSPHKIINRSYSPWKILGDKINKTFKVDYLNLINRYIP